MHEMFARASNVFVRLVFSPFRSNVLCSKDPIYLLNLFFCILFRLFTPCRWRCCYEFFFFFPFQTIKWITENVQTSCIYYLFSNIKNKMKYTIWRQANFVQIFALLIDSLPNGMRNGCFFDAEILWFLSTFVRWFRSSRTRCTYIFTYIIKINEFSSSQNFHCSLLVCPVFKGPIDFVLTKAERTSFTIQFVHLGSRTS